MNHNIVSADVTCKKKMIRTAHLTPEQKQDIADMAEQEITWEDAKTLFQLGFWRGSECCADLKDIKKWIKWAIHEGSLPASTLKK